MPIHNDDVAKVFEKIADLLDIRGENRFRIRAYRNAAREVRNLPRELAGMVEEKADLTDLPGIGETLAGKIREVVKTGICQALKKLEKRVPPDLTELLHLSGLGPKRVHALHYDLDILVTAQNAASVIERFVSYDEVARVQSVDGATDANIKEIQATVGMDDAAKTKRVEL